MQEHWESIKNYPYEVSNLGRVRRTEDSFNNSYKVGRLLKPFPTKKGYMLVVLCRNNVRKAIQLHRLVLETFIGKRPEGYECNHKDGNKANNRLKNLEWITQQQNIAHAYRNSLRGDFKGEKNKFSKLKNGEVWLIKKLLASKKFKQRFIAKMFKITGQNVYIIKTGKGWAHINYP